VSKVGTGGGTQVVKFSKAQSEIKKTVHKFEGPTVQNKSYSRQMLLTSCCHECHPTDKQQRAISIPAADVISYHCIWLYWNCH
jgi:hypothetical protein